MDFSGCSNFEDLLRACGYTNSHNANSTTNECNNPGCFDIPNGFQTLNPELFVAISGVLGQIMAGNLPFNVQNALGNWFELLGQVILTYNAQQQYFQSGPGRYFSPENYNINNQFCNTSQNTTQSSNSNKSNKKSSKNESKDSKKNNKNSSTQNNLDKINELESRINDLMAEIETIKKTINISN